LTPDPSSVRHRIPPAIVGAWVRPARARERAFDLVRTAGEALPARPQAGRVERIERARWMLADRFVQMPPRTAAAVVGVRDAVARLADVTTMRVDGTSGRVEPVG
jgi:hypothetical protein